MDDEKIMQVLLNLIRSGLEATGPGGAVELMLGLHENHAELTIQDDGPGLLADAPRRSH